MNISVFTNEFLPQLVQQYTQETIDFHGLVDIDLWRRLFPTPDSEDKTAEITWSQMRLNAFSLQDGTLLLTYELPNPTQPKQPKFIGIRIDRKSRDARYYVLLRARYYDEPWEIHSIDFTTANTTGHHDLRFLRMIEGTWSLRNFVLTVQQTQLIESKTSIFQKIKGSLSAKNLFQEE